MGTVPSNRPLNLVHERCCVCSSDDAAPIGVGRDYEYATSPDEFVAMQCSSCSLVYLSPRPSVEDFSTIYPKSYHAFEFSAERYGFVHKVRSRLEARRLLSWCRNLPDNARIIDVGCGDGFHLDLLKRYGKATWNLEGIDLDRRAVVAARDRGLNVHHGALETVDLDANSYHLAIAIQTIEHVEKPAKLLSDVYRILKPGGRLIVVTDNTDSPDFSLFKSGYWGGYHFPRHWNLFNRRCLTTLAKKAKFSAVNIETAVSPVNWVYSIHNALVDCGAPRPLRDWFTLKSTASLSVFTAVDTVMQKFGRAALLRAEMTK
jgi:SAM-dependent methyltransferase